MQPLRDGKARDEIGKERSGVGAVYRARAVVLFSSSRFSSRCVLDRYTCSVFISQK